MPANSYHLRRGQIETYFDRTAVDAWKRLTSDAPVGRIRATVRAGRDEMRATLLSWLPADMRGIRLLDAGCGTGALTIEAARRGAHVVAIDLSPTLVQHAKESLPRDVDPAMIDFRSGDMLADSLGAFDHVVAMDSLIHYDVATGRPPSNPLQRDPWRDCWATRSRSQIGGVAKHVGSRAAFINRRRWSCCGDEATGRQTAE